MPINCTLTYKHLTNDTEDTSGDIGAIPAIGPVYAEAQFADGAAALGTDATGYSIRRFEGYLDTDGILKNKPGGTAGMRVWANDPLFNLERLPYKVLFDLYDALGRPLPLNGTTFDAPSTDVAVPLVNVLPVPGAMAGGVIRRSSYAEDILDSGATGRDLVRAATQAIARTAIGLDLVDLDEWEWFANFAAFPPVGVTTIVYGDLATGALYRWNGSAYVPATQDVAARTHLATSKASPADADEIPWVDSGAAFALKKISFGNLKAALLPYNILDPAYGVTIGTASSQTAAIKAALDANPGKAFHFPPGNYRLDTTLTVSADNSLLLAPGARIYAGAAMTTLINYDNGQTATDSLAADRFISGYGVLDGALLADKILRVASVLRFSLEGLTFLDGVHRGLLVDAYAAEVSGHNLRFANTTTSNVSDNVAIEAVGNDCRFSQIGMRDWTIGVWDKGANIWIDIHPWIGTTAQLTARYQNSVAFKIQGDSLFIAPYADTYRSSFQGSQTSPAFSVARIVAPKVFCASGNLTNTLAALYPGVVFDFLDAGSAFIVSNGKFAGHPVTNHALTSGPSKRLTIKNSLAASYITGFTGFNDVIRGVTLGIGSFTPTLYGATVAGTQAYTLQTGQVEVRDGVVSYQFQIKATPGSTISGDLHIGGLPLPTGAASTNVGQGAITYSTGGVRASSVIGGNGSATPLEIIPVVTDGGVVELTDVAASGVPVTTATIDSSVFRNVALEIWGQIECSFNYQAW